MSSLQQLKNTIEEFTYRGKRIPHYMHDSIISYIQEGFIDRDDFLWNIVTNNLCMVFRTADSTNINLIDVYVAFFYNEVPSNCWGSIQTVHDYCSSKLMENSNV